MTTHVPRAVRASTARGSDRSRETLRILTANITTGRWPLNSRIPTEAQLMAELGVGRSTLREAISSLTALGMLEPARSRGTFVRSQSPVSAVLSDFIGRHENAEILQVRRLLEAESTRLAALLRTDEHVERLAAAHQRDLDEDTSQGVVRGATPGEFHAIILEASGNTLMADLHAGLMRGVRAAMARGEMVPKITAAERLVDHGRILEAIRDGDPERAQQAAAEHVDHDLTTAE